MSFWDALKKIFSVAKDGAETVQIIRQGGVRDADRRPPRPSHKVPKVTPKGK